MKILIVKPSSLGDIVHTLPAVHMIRKAHPEAIIHWLVNDSLAPIVELSPDIDETILFSRKRLAKLKHVPELFQLIHRLRTERYDAVIDFQGLFRSAFFARMTKAPQIVGFANAREGAPIFYHRKIELPDTLTHAVDKNNYLAQSFIGAGAADPVFPELKRFDDYTRAAEQLLSANHMLDDAKKPILAIAPCSRWESKTWPPEFFAEVIKKIHEENRVSIWLLGTAAERPVGETIQSLCEEIPLANFMGETNLGTMVEILRRSAGLVCNDSGPMHIAAALQTPTFALFGPTKPELTGPYGPIHTVFETDMSCRPCRNRVCPLKNENKFCHTQIQPVAVAQAVSNHLKQLTPELPLEAHHDQTI